MKDFVLHVGLPKTATTALRKHVYSRLPGYLGSLSAMQHRDDEVRNIQLIYARFANDGISGGLRSLHPALAKWVAELRKPINNPTVLVNHRLSEWAFADDLKSPVRLVSDVDDFAQAPPRENPLPPFLEALRETLPGDIRLRVVVSLRRQPEWLASLYAQSARTMRRPGQDDFESKMRRIVRENDDRLDFASLVRGIHDAIDPTNVLTLLLEDGLADHVTSLGSFLNLPELNETLNLAPENVRQTDERTWRLNHERTVRFRRIRRVANSNLIPASLRVPAMSTTKHAERVTAVAAQRLREARWGGTVVLQPETREMLLAHCEPHNRRLSAIVGRDLVSHGYVAG